MSIAQAYKLFTDEVKGVVKMHEEGMITDHEMFSKITELVVKNNSEESLAVYSIREEDLKSDENVQWKYPTPKPERTYRYVKRCEICGKDYYNNEITKEVYLNGMDNPALDVVNTSDESMLIITSKCEECCSLGDSYELQRTRQ